MCIQHPAGFLLSQAFATISYKCKLLCSPHPPQNTCLCDCTKPTSSRMGPEVMPTAATFQDTNIYYLNRSVHLHKIMAIADSAGSIWAQPPKAKTGCRKRCTGDILQWQQGSSSPPWPNGKYFREQNALGWWSARLPCNIKIVAKGKVWPALIHAKVILHAK